VPSPFGTELRFRETRHYEVTTLSKLGPAVGNQILGIAVSPYKTGDLEIWGLNASFGLQITVIDPGKLIVKFRLSNVASISGDQTVLLRHPDLPFVGSFFWNKLAPEGEPSLFWSKLRQLRRSTKQCAVKENPPGTDDSQLQSSLTRQNRKFLIFTPERPKCFHPSRCKMAFLMAVLLYLDSRDLRIMAANLEDQLNEKVRALSPNKQQEALRLLDTLASGASSEPNGTRVDRRPIWEIIEEVNAALPADTWENVPTDGSLILIITSTERRSGSRVKVIALWKLHK